MRPWNRIRAGARRVGRGLRVVLDKVPPTPLGLLLLGAAAVAVLYYGRVRQDLVLYVTGFGVAALVLLAQLFVTLTTVLLAIAWRPAKRPPERLEAGAEAPTGFSLASLGWLPLVSVRWQWIEPTDVTVAQRLKRGRLVEEVAFRERGEHTRTVRRVVIEDVFGLARMGLRFVEETPRVVVPARGRPLTAPILDALAGGDAVSHPLGPPDGDLVEMRRYVAGDPMKRVLWKTYARSRQLMVRTPERAFAPTRRTLAYLVAGDADEPPAGAARLALETQAFGPDWRFGADGSDDVARTVEEAMRLVIRSRSARDRGGRGLGGFLEKADDFGSFRCILFAPARPGPWVEAVETHIRRCANQVEIILCADGMREEEPARRRWKRLFLLPTAEELRPDVARAAEVDALAWRLRATGAKVSFLDRQTGKLHAGGGRRRAA